MINFFRRILILFLAFAPFLSFCSGTSPTQEEIKALYQKAFQYTFNSTFHVKGVKVGPEIREREEWFFSKGRCRFEIYHPQVKNGKRVILDPDPSGTGYITWAVEFLPDGTESKPTIINFAPVQSFHYHFKDVVTFATDEHLNGATFELSDVQFNKKYCKRIVVTFSDADEFLENAPATWFLFQGEYRRFKKPIYIMEQILTRRITKEEYWDNREILRQIYAKKIEIIVDETPEKPFIYAYYYYCMNGEKVIYPQFVNVSFPESFPEELFAQPDGGEVRRWKTQSGALASASLELQDFPKLQAKRLREKNQKISTATYMQKVYRFFLKNGVVIGISVAGVAFLVVLGIKWYQKRQYR